MIGEAALAGSGVAYAVFYAAGTTDSLPAPQSGIVGVLVATTALVSAAGLFYQSKRTVRRGEVKAESRQVQTRSDVRSLSDEVAELRTELRVVKQMGQNQQQVFQEMLVSVVQALVSEGRNPRPGPITPPTP